MDKSQDLKSPSQEDSEACFCLTGVLSYLETSARDFIPGGPDSWRLEKDTFFWGLKQVKITHKPFSQNNKKLKPYSSLTVLSFAVKIRRIDGDIFFFSFLKNSGLPFNVVTVSICSSCFHGERHRAVLNVLSFHPH